MTDDWLGLEDDGERKAAAGPAFVVGPRSGEREALVQEQMHRAAARDFPGAGEVLFIADDGNGGECWDPPQPPDFADEGERWKRLMKWPVIPSIADALQFKISAERACEAAWWGRLSEARAADDSERPALPSARPKLGSLP